MLFQLLAPGLTPNSPLESESGLEIVTQLTGPKNGHLHMYIVYGVM